MNVAYASAFLKDMKQIKDRNLIGKVGEVVERVKAADSLAEIPNLKKLKGFKTLYRIRIGGDYRLGFSFENNVVTFSRFEHRSRIYK